MLEATMHACRHPVYRDRYQATKKRLGRQRGAKVAQVDCARRLTEAIWHMLTLQSARSSTCQPRAGSARIQLRAPMMIDSTEPVSYGLHLAQCA